MAFSFMFYAKPQSSSHAGSDLLLESGDFLLLEDGSSTLVLEG